MLSCLSVMSISKARTQTRFFLKILEEALLSIIIDGRKFFLFLRRKKHVRCTLVIFSCECDFE